jgi:hypothetical protein
MDTQSNPLNTPEIVDLTPENMAAIKQTAKLLMDGQAHDMTNKQSRVFSGLVPPATQRKSGSRRKRRR